MSIGTVIYGPRYCGKTSFCEAIDDAFRIYTDEWEGFKDMVDLVSPESIVTVENIHRLLESCTDYVCDTENEEHPQLAGNRKSIVYKKIKQEMKDVFFALAEKASHVFYTCSMETTQLDSTLYKGTYFYPKFDWVLEDIMPSITDQTICMIPSYKSVKAKHRATGEVSIKRKEKRIMICSARPDIYAGDSTGKLPKEFCAGESGEEAYQNYMKEME